MLPTTPDSLLVVSFGGPERPEEVLPFLTQLLRHRGLTQESLDALARRYDCCGGVSPLNQQTRELARAFQTELAHCGWNLPVYWGNRNWRPYLQDTLQHMTTQGHRHALAFLPSPYESYPSRWQYLEDIAQARSAIGPQAPIVEPLPAYYRHPNFVAPMARMVQQVRLQLEATARERSILLFSAHSLPQTQTGPYTAQLHEACRLVAEHSGATHWTLAYQSRSGPPSEAWLEPSLTARLGEIARQTPRVDVIVTPIGFISDHMEVILDLDQEAQTLCQSLGLRMHRTPTVGTDAQFVAIIGQMLQEHTQTSSTEEFSN